MAFYLVNKTAAIGSCMKVYLIATDRLFSAICRAHKELFLAVFQPIIVNLIAFQEVCPRKQCFMLQYCIDSYLFGELV